MYHYSNFDEVYKKFDRNDLILLDEDFRGAGEEKMRNEMTDYYESFSYLGKIRIRHLQHIF